MSATFNFSIILVIALGFLKLFSCEFSDISFEEVYADILKWEDYIIEIRRYLHQHPETRFEEYETSEYLQKVLKDNNITFTANWGIDKFNPERGGTGIIAQVGTGHPPTVVLRADIDALPIHELADVAFKSTHPGKMHACGHDVHTTMLMGSAIHLKRHEHEIEGTVKFMFTPAEEGGGGAKMMIDEGALEVYPPAQRVFGMHIFPPFVTGEIRSKAGIFSGGVDHLTIIVTGKGGHSAMPHATIDPIPASLAIVRGIYDIYARETYLHHEHAGLLGVTHFEAGSGATNVIPDKVLIGGTVQALKTDKMNYLKKRVKDLAESIAEAYQCTAKISHRDTPYIALENDPDYYEFGKEVLKECSVDKKINLYNPQFGGDDFAFFNEYCPSLYARIGIGSGSEIPGHVPTNVSYHNAYFAVDERVLARGASVNSMMAIKTIQYLKD